MTGLNDVLSRRYGIYRAGFAGRDLGEMALAPEICTDCEIVKVPVCDENSASGYDEIGNVPRLFGSAALRLFATDTVWKTVAENSGSAGELTVESEHCKLVFPVAHLLPRWEFAPTSAGAHTLCIHFQLKSDSTGKIFYYIG